MNREIDAPEVRLIGENGDQLGVVPISRALAMADEKELDLVEISPTASPPVCRIMDYGKFKYEQQKKQHQLKRKTQTHEIKQVRIRTYRIDKHDLAIKVTQIRSFLEEGSRVVITLKFRARENAYDHLGRDLLNTMAAMLEDVAKVDAPPQKEGQRMNLSLSPLPAVLKALQQRNQKADAEKRKSQRLQAVDLKAKDTDKVNTLLEEATRKANALADAVENAGDDIDDDDDDDEIITTVETTETPATDQATDVS